MQKLKMETPDISALNAGKIASVFPSAVSEGKINFDRLRLFLGESVAEIFKLISTNTSMWVI